MIPCGKLSRGNLQNDNPEGTDNLKSRDDNQVEVKEMTVRLRKEAWI